MHCEVRRPHSIMDHSLPVVPLLEIISFVLLMSWMQFLQKDHSVHQLSLSETFINKQIVFLMHRTVTTLANSSEDFIPSSQCGWVVGLEWDFRWPIAFSVMCSHWVHLLFIPLDSVWSANVISVNPAFSVFLSSGKFESDEACEEWSSEKGVVESFVSLFFYSCGESSGSLLGACGSEKASSQHLLLLLPEII